MPKTPATELVVFTVTDREAAEAARAGAMRALSAYPGFIRWVPLSGIDDEKRFADLVEWESYDAAKSAADKVMSDPAFGPYIARVAEVTTMAHFRVSTAA